MDTWFPDDEKPSPINSLPGEEAEARPAFSANCAKCGAYTPDYPELRGWWPAIDGKLCKQGSAPPVYPNQELTWYCKRCYVEESGNIVLRVIRKFLK